LGNVDAQNEEPEFHVIGTWSGSLYNSTSGIDPVLSSIQTTDEIEKSNRNPVDEQLEILEILSFLSTMIITFFIFL